MNIIFFGSAQFSIPSLKALLSAGSDISCVVTQPDRKKGRGLHLSATAVKKIAQGYKLKIYQPQKINTPESEEFLKSLKPDLFVVIAYGQILSRSILNIPEIFSLNVHSSLLPEYRGAAPVNWAIINGGKTTGVTLIKMTEKMDAGPVIRQKRLDINEDDNQITLENRLSLVAAELLTDFLKNMKNNDYKLTEQDEKMATFAPKLKKQDGSIDWNKSAESINNLIKGCLVWPGAFTNYNGKMLKIYGADVAEKLENQKTGLPGGIIQVSRDGIVVSTGEGNLSIRELQIEGKRVMGVEEFIAGHKVRAGDRFDNK